MVYCYGIKNKPVDVRIDSTVVRVYPLVYLFKPWPEFWSAVQWGDRNVGEGTKKQVRIYDRVIRHFVKMKKNGAEVKYVAVTDDKGKISAGSAVYRVVNPVFPGIWWDDYDPGTLVGIYVPPSRRGEEAVLASVFIYPKSSVFYRLENNSWIPYINRLSFDGSRIRRESILYQDIYPGQVPEKGNPLLEVSS